jgi:hypothetical protein
LVTSPGSNKLREPLNQRKLKSGLRWVSKPTGGLWYGSGVCVERATDTRTMLIEVANRLDESGFVMEAHFGRTAPCHKVGLHRQHRFIAENEQNGEPRHPAVVGLTAISA